MKKSVLIILLIIFILLWFPYLYFSFVENFKKDTIKSLTGDWKIIFPKGTSEYDFNDGKIVLEVLTDTKEIDKYYNIDETKPAGVHILRCIIKDKLLIEFCGYDGLETSSCIIFGNFDLDKDEEILLVYYKDINGVVNNFTIMKLIEEKVFFYPVDENNTIGKYIKQYFKSTYFIGFPEAMKKIIFFYIGIIGSVILLIVFAIMIVVRKK